MTCIRYNAPNAPTRPQFGKRRDRGRIEDKLRKQQEQQLYEQWCDDQMYNGSVEPTDSLFYAVSSALMHYVLCCCSVDMHVVVW